MTTPFEDIASLNKLIHEPARLAIMTALSVAKSADFLYLQSMTGLSKGNLSAHLSKLEDAKLVAIDKHFKGKKPVTTISLTQKGLTVATDYWNRLEQLRSQVTELRENPET